MPLSRMSKRGLWAVTVVIIAAGAGAGAWAWREAEKGMRAELGDRVSLAAAAFESGDLAVLTASRADVGTPAYQRLKERLRRLQGASSGVRFVYVFRCAPDGSRVTFLADSAAPGAKDESVAGDDYREAAQSPGLQEIIRRGSPSIEGPLGDEFGTWVTGYALVADRTLAAGPVRDILGMDIDAGDWRHAKAGAFLRHALYAWILLGLPWLALLAARRSDRQRELIRNLSEAMEQSHSAILIIDLESRIEFANRGLCRQTGYRREEVTGRNWRDFQRSEQGSEIMAGIVASVRAGRPWEGEWLSRHRDGREIPVRGVVTPVLGKGGALSCFVAVFDDISDLRRREVELREARDQAEAADRAKSQFLATMSHEVRTPLNGIVGFSSLLLETRLTSEQREYIDTIRVSTESLIQLTGDIMDFARIESGRLKLDEAPCDPRETVEDALDLVAAKAAEKGIELLHRVADNLPAAVLLDGGRLRQVLVNLVGNAVKFTPSGEVEVRLAWRPAAVPTGLAAEEGLLEVTVRDTGIGIPAAQMGRLFKPFTQLDESTTRRYGGTGLGLAICRHLIEIMGGRIAVTSEVGRGSTFTFTLPIRQAAAAPAVPRLGGLRIGLCIASDGLRAELAELLTRWEAVPVVLERPEGHAQHAALTVVELTPAIVDRLLRGIAPRPGWDPANCLALLPLSEPSERRAVLRSHFRLLVNKPVHQRALWSLLTGSRPGAPDLAGPSRQLGLKVLVVEDHEVNQRLLQHVLESLGCTWRAAGDGRTALQLLRETEGGFDVVLLDLHLPEMDGWALLDAIRRGAAGEKARRVWVQVVTADVRREVRERALAAGVDDFLTKPLEPGELEAALERFRAGRPGV